MTNVIPTEQEKQKEFSRKLDNLAAKSVSIESLEEAVKEGLNDLTVIIKECSGLKTPEAKALAKSMVAVRVDAAKAKKDEEEKVVKAKAKIEEYQELSEELSVLAQYQINIADKADEYLGQ